MIYTVGEIFSYSEALREYLRIWKTGRSEDYSGGYAFQTVDDALRFLAESGNADDWCVWGISADWETDTYPAPDGWWHYLSKDAEIVDIRESKAPPD